MQMRKGCLWLIPHRDICYIWSGEGEAVSSKGNPLINGMKKNVLDQDAGYDELEVNGLVEGGVTKILHRNDSRQQ